MLVEPSAIMVRVNRSDWITLAALSGAVVLTYSVPVLSALRTAATLLLGVAVVYAVARGVSTRSRRIESLESEVRQLREQQRDE